MGTQHAQQKFPSGAVFSLQYMHQYPSEPPSDLKSFGGIIDITAEISSGVHIMSYHIAPGLTQARQISRHIVDIFTPKTQAYIEKYIGISRDVRREGKVGIVSFVLGDPCTWDAGDAAVHRKSGPM